MTDDEYYQSLKDLRAAIDKLQDEIERLENTIFVANANIIQKKDQIENYQKKLRLLQRS